MRVSFPLPARCLALAAALAAGAGLSAVARPLPPHPRLTLRRAPRLPLLFVPSSQAPEPGGVLFSAQAGSSAALLLRQGLILRTASPIPAAAPAAAPRGLAFAGMPAAPPAPRVRVQQERLFFVGANPRVRIEPLDRQKARVNVFTGRDPSRWAHGLPTYAQVRYRNLYPGIDLVYYGDRQNRIEFDFVVHPGADAGQIRFRLAGQRRAKLLPSGNLAAGGLRLLRPVLYQDVAGGKRAIVGSFVPLKNGDYGIHTGLYDIHRPLVIDPKINLLYATYAGGQHIDIPWDMYTDAAGNTYITGQSASQDFPVTGNAYQTVRKNIGVYAYDAVVMKFDPSGTLLYSTFLGGTLNDYGQAIVADAAGNAYIGGETDSTDFPVTANAFQAQNGGGDDAFLAKLSPDGSQLLYSTYLGGSGEESMIRMKLNADGSLWLFGTASAPGLPASANAYQKQPNGKDNVFVAKAVFDANGNLSLPDLTFLGGSSAENDLVANANGDITTDSSGNVYIASGTYSGNFPVTANAFEKPFTLSQGCFVGTDPNSLAYVAKFSPDLSQLLYSTALGGHTEALNGGGEPVCNQFARTIHLDAQGNIWVIGTTGTSDFPVTSNAVSSQLGTNGQAGVDDFVVELSADGSKELYGTYLGGTGWEYGARAVWDAQGNIWIHGTTNSTDFPVTSDALQAANAGGYDAMVTELSPDGTKILYATYLGGSGDEDFGGHGAFAIDGFGTLHLAGDTTSTNFPVTADAFQSKFANGDIGADGSDMYYAILGTGAIGSVQPTSAGNGGDSTLTIQGAGFAQGATCNLSLGGTSIAAASTFVNSTGTAITCYFPLSGAAAGSYTVTVSNPDGSSISKPGAFTVQNGSQPDLAAGIVSRPAFRVGAPATFFITASNSGTQDAYVVPLWISLPSGFTFSINGESQTLSASQSVTLNTTTYISLLLPLIQAGHTETIPLVITSPAAPIGLSLTAELQAPWFRTLAALNAVDPTTFTPACVPDPTNSYFQNCFGAYLALADASQLGTGTHDDLQRRQYGLVEKVCQMVSSVAQAMQNGQRAGQAALKVSNPSSVYNPPKLTLTSAGEYNAYNFGFTNGVLQGIAQFAGNANAQSNGHSAPPILGHLMVSATGLPHVLRTRSLQNLGVTFDPRVHRLDAGSCDQPPPPPPPPISTSSLASSYVSSVDPNYKGGATGDNSASHFMRGGVPLPYTVGFENEPTATAPAAQVVVTDQLDTTKVDPSTAVLTTIAFGSNLISLPAGSNNYNSVVALSSSLSVRIQGSVDPNSGLLKWTFTSIDPSTGLPPTDPTVGFLPPDKDGVEGQGSVVFTVMPRSGLATGTAITNTATVVFDANAPINTPVWTNTMDVDPPVSKVTALPANTTQTSFPVTWSGTDKGSGVATYDVYVIDNGGAPTLWQSQVTVTSATYTGTAGHTYGFFSIATDKAGNQEAMKSAPDTSTALGAPAPADFTVAASPGSITVTAGQSGTSSIAVTPENGFNQAVSFSCSGLPSLASCSFSPTSVAPSGTAASATTLTITTTAASAAPPAGDPSTWWWFGGGLLLLGLAGLRKRLGARIRLAIVIGAAALALACGGGTGGGTTTPPPPPPQPGTPAGTSSVTVTATSGSGSSAISHTTVITLTVQ